MEKKKNKVTYGYDINDVINLWNQKVKGYHKTVRIRTPYKDSVFQKKFRSAQAELATLGEWAKLIDETLKLFDDPFWQERKGKQSLMWLFQRRGKVGEINWIYYYEQSIEGDEHDNNSNKLYEQYFGSSEDN